MRVNVQIIRDVEMEINSPALTELDEFWKTHDQGEYPYEELIDEVVKAVEDATGLPFGGDGPETISAIYTMDGETLLED